MKLILAQGNPGPNYESTHHNVGFLAMDQYASKNKVEFQTKSKFYADIAELTVGDEKVLLVKPTTYYNDTGKAALALAQFYKVHGSDILVLHDELALPFGSLRVRDKGSDAGNNGIKSLNAALGQEYHRLRIGIRSEIAERNTPYDFVLSKITKHDLKILHDTVFPKVGEIIDSFIAGKLELTSYTLGEK